MKEEIVITKKYLTRLKGVSRKSRVPIPGISALGIPFDFFSSFAASTRKNYDPVSPPGKLSSPFGKVSTIISSFLRHSPPSFESEERINPRRPAAGHAEQSLPPPPPPQGSKCLHPTCLIAREKIIGNNNKILSYFALRKFFFEKGTMVQNVMNIKRIKK